MSNERRYLVAVAFAVLVFGLGFYALVIYEYTLDPLIVGALVSMMTTAVNWVFAEQAVTSATRRAQANFEAGAATSGPGTVVVDSGPPATTTVNPPGDG